VAADTVGIREESEQKETKVTEEETRNPKIETTPTKGREHAKASVYQMSEGVKFETGELLSFVSMISSIG
jgi:hypothetical protein